MGASTLRDLVLKARDFANDERIPFARVPWTPDSAVVWREDGSTTPIEIDGHEFKYFIEPFIIVEQFEPLLDGPDQNAVIHRVIQYAENDA